MNTEVIYTRRGFVKLAAGAVAAAALVATGASTLDIDKAFAADGIAIDAMEIGEEYTVTANLYVKAKFNAILNIDAYLTNATTPNLIAGKLPNKPVSDNAKIKKTMVQADGTPVFEVRISELNNTFGLTEIADAGNPATATVKAKSFKSGWTSACDQRIEAITFEVTGQNSGQQFEAKEYANFMNQGAKEWPVTLTVDFSSIK